MMNVLRKVGAIFMGGMLVMSLFLTGCGKSTSQSLVGKWESDQTQQVIEFKEDGSYIGFKQTNYKYKVVSDHALKITNPEYTDGSDAIDLTFTLEGDQLTTTFNGDQVTWHRK